MGILNGGAHVAFCPRALGLSLAARARHNFCEPDDVTATVRGGVCELGNHALEATIALICGSTQRIILRSLFFLLLLLQSLLLLQISIELLLLLLLLLQLLLNLLLKQLLLLLLELLLLLLHLHYKV